MARIFNFYRGHPGRIAMACFKISCLTHFIFTYGVHPGAGAGVSMMPTLDMNGEIFIVDKRYRRGRGIKVGDCVVYRIPVEQGETGLKRVMGMPGDYVLLNSPPGTDRGSEGEKAADLSAGSPLRNMIQVPQGHCFLMGDNLPWSRDSRDFGPIPLALVNGRVALTVKTDSWWPGSWFRRVPNSLEPVNS